MNRSLRLGALGCAGMLAIAACSNSAVTSPDAGSPGAAGGSGASGSSGGGGLAGSAAGEGVAGADGGAAGASDAGGTGGIDGAISHGSPGCGHEPAPGDRLGFVVSHTVDVAGLADVYLAGGAFAQTSGTFDLSRRPYGLRLPATYDPNRSWPVVVQAVPCGVDAATWDAMPQQGSGVYAPPKDVIAIYLLPVKTCLLPGGPAIGNRADSPDVPYFRAALADAKSSACIDESRVTIAGFGSSAAREAEMLACAASDVIRAVTAYGGGLLAHRPPCKGPVAAMLVAPTIDSANPLGPVATTDPSFMSTDNLGTLPLRDEILQRNGCTGTGTQPWNPGYPGCVRFVGCPAATPVVWCPIMVTGRSPGAPYAPAGWWAFASMLPSLD